MALFIRTQLAWPGLDFVDAATYNQLFTMHGTTMIFFFVMPMMTGLANYIVPLQIGAADMAFPRINALSYWMVPLSGVLLYSGTRSAARPTLAGPATPRCRSRKGRASTCGSPAWCWWARARSWARSTSSPRSSRCARPA
jgi:hypothetical protein